MLQQSASFEFEELLFLNYRKGTRFHSLGKNTIHYVDQQNLTFHPAQPNAMWSANDAGVCGNESDGAHEIKSYNAAVGISV